MRAAYNAALIAFALIVAALGPACAVADAAQLSFQELLARDRPVATKRIPYGRFESQFGELWLPSGAGPHRVVILIHGGCWSARLPGLDMMAYAAEGLRRRGNAVWNIEYRRLGEPGAGYPGSFEDVATAVDELKTLAKTYPLDLANVVVVGHSAGGHMGLWAAARPRLPPDSPLQRKDPLRIKGAVSLAGIADLKLYRDRGPGVCSEARAVDRLVATAARSPHDAFADTSPAALLPIRVPQIVISGALDPVVPAEFGRHYGKMAAAAGDKIEAMTIANAGHIDLIDPASAAFEQVRLAIERLQK